MKAIKYFKSSAIFGCASKKYIKLFAKNRKNLIAQMNLSGALFNSKHICQINADSSMPFQEISDIFNLTATYQELTILMLFPDTPNKERLQLKVK